MSLTGTALTAEIAAAMVKRKRAIVEDKEILLDIDGMKWLGLCDENVRMKELLEGF